MEVPRPEGDQPGRPAALAAVHGGARLEDGDGDPVDHQYRRSRLEHLEPQALLRVEDQGPIEEHVRGDRCHHDGPQPGGQHNAMTAAMRMVWPGTVFSTLASLSAVRCATTWPPASRTVTSRVIRSST